MTRRFYLQPVATRYALLGVAILVALGTWQLHRRAWKIDLIAAVETRSTGVPITVEDALKKRADGEDMRYQLVELRGQYNHARETHVFGTLGPTPGYYIFTPFEALGQGAIAEQDRVHIYVNRGFVPQAFKAPGTRAQGQVPGPLILRGLFREAEEKPVFARWLTPNHQPDENIWYTREPILFARAAYGEPVSSPDNFSFYVDSLGEENSANMPRGGATKVEFNNRHLEYALTWYGLALTLIGVWFAFSWRREE